MSAIALSLWLLAGTAPDVRANGVGLAEDFDHGVLVVIADAHACHRFDVFLATGSGQRGRGLMFVRSMPATSGMLFVYERDAYLSMYMRNTYIPLDMLFVRSDGSVASVAHDTEPLSERSIVAPEPVRYVLELNAGVAQRLSIDSDSILLLPVEAVRTAGSTGGE